MMWRTCALRAVTAGGLFLAIAQGNAKAGLQAWPLLLSPAQMALTPTMLVAGNPVPAMPSELPGAPAPALQQAQPGIYDLTEYTAAPARSSRVYHAPDAPPTPESLVSFDYHEPAGLAGTPNDERSVPLGTMAVMGLSPGGFSRVMSGRPAGGLTNWTEASETSVSYIRPHVNVQMMMAFEIPGPGQAPDFEGPGFNSHARLDLAHSLRLDSEDIGAQSSRFGVRPRPTPVDEPQTAVAVGLDLGLLPTFLSQMGLSVSVVASRGAQSGATRIALVGTTELPVDWAPRERPIQHPVGFAVSPVAAGGPPLYTTPLTVAGTNPPPPPPPPPPVPEPATIVLLGSGLAAVLVRRRADRR
jgi:hypothetical protein